MASGFPLSRQTPPPERTPVPPQHHSHPRPRQPVADALVPMAIVALLLVIGIRQFRRMEKRFADVI